MPRKIKKANESCNFDHIVEAKMKREKRKKKLKKKTKGDEREAVGGGRRGDR